MFLLRLRAVFEKTGRAKFISHLDLNRCMLRIFRRSKLPVWYTEGFNPHPYYSFALALSLGFESSCEIMDFNITDDNMPLEEVRDRLNAVMPEGMRIISVAEQVKKITAITKAEYAFSFACDEPEALHKAANELLGQQEIPIEKKTKKGVKTVNIKDGMEIIDIARTEDSVDFVMRLPAGTQTNFNPMLFMEALKNYCDILFEAQKIRRTGILCENNEKFS